MKKSISFIAIVVLFCLTVSSQTIREKIQERRANRTVSGTDSTSLAPDYSDLYFWAAHPAKKDMSDSIPAFLISEKRDTLADVFFLHPTTFTKNPASQSNASLDD